MSAITDLSAQYQSMASTRDVLLDTQGEAEEIAFRKPRGSFEWEIADAAARKASAMSGAVHVMAELIANTPSTSPLDRARKLSVLLDQRDVLDVDESFAMVIRELVSERMVVAALAVSIVRDLVADGTLRAELPS